MRLDDAEGDETNFAACACPAGQAVVAREQAQATRTAWIYRQLEQTVRSEMALPKRCEGFTLETWPNREDAEGRKAFDKVRHFLEDWDRVGWLVLLGAYGTGKTGLAAAILDHLVPSAAAGEIYGENNAPALLFTTAEQFFRRIKAGYITHTDAAVFDQHANAGVLVLDDVGAEADTDWAQRQYFALLNKRYDDLRPTIITTNLALEDLEAHLTPRVWYRVMERAKFIEVKGRNLHDPKQRTAAGGTARLRAIR